MKLRERQEGQPEVLKAAEGALRERSPELRGDWGRSHGLEEAGHMTIPITPCCLLLRRHPGHRDCQGPQL